MTESKLQPDSSRHIDGVPIKQSVAVVTDSAAALTQSLLTTNGIHVASMEVTIGHETFVDGPDGALDNFYARLRRVDKLPTTSAPKPGAWLEAFKAAARQSDSILCITLSAGLSAAYDAARVAAEMAADDLPGVQITVLDSKSAAGSQALIVLECARMASAGKPLDEIHQRAKALAEKVKLVAYLDTLEYVHRGGRVPKIAVWATNLFNIKPVMEFSSGKVGSIARPRSRSGAYKRLLKEVTNDMAGLSAHINVMHADAEGEARTLMDAIGKQLKCDELFLTQFHPFMGAHTGPGLVGVSYWGE